MPIQSRQLSITDFNNSCKNIQENEAFHFAKYLDTILGYALYYYNGFFIETSYNLQTNNIDTMKAISAMDASHKFAGLDSILNSTS